MAFAKPQVVASAALPLDLKSLLGDGIGYFEPSAGHLEREQLLAVLREAGSAGQALGLICLLTDTVDEELLDAASGLRVVANFAVGLDNVEVASATRRGVVVTNTPDVLTDATADFTFALLLAAARRVVQGDAWVRSGDWPGWAPGQHMGADVTGATLGIIGLGRIGCAVAKRARAFSMEVLAVEHPTGGAADTEPSPSHEHEGVQRVSLQELLSRSDFVSLHCPLRAETRHIIDASALACMKPNAILVNTARGLCVHEEALCAALEQGRLAGAGLDVFEHEPRISQRLVACERVVLAPHAGSATYTARRRMGEICANAVRAVLEGRRPVTIVNPEVLIGAPAV